MPPSLTLILRQRLERVWGEGRSTFLTCTHCVATPSRVSPTRFTSAVSVCVCEGENVKYTNVRHNPSDLVLYNSKRYMYVIYRAQPLSFGTV